MNNSISLKSIKYESIKGIFTSVANAERISRAEISKQTGLSLVTVGKIADALLELNIVSQIKEIRPQAGRRAGLLSVNPDKYALILDVTSYAFRWSILNLRLEPLERAPYSYRSGLTFEENFIAFLEETMHHIAQNYGLENCFGLGVAVPGPYLEAEDLVCTSRVPELNAFHLREIISSRYPDIPLLIDSHINAAARSHIRNLEHYEQKNIVYWYVGERYVCGVYIVKGDLVLGRNGHACEFGSLIQLTERTMDDRLSFCKTQEECAEALAISVYNVNRILSPHSMIFDFDLPYDCDRVIPLLNDLLTMKYRLKPNEMPELVRAFCKFRNSHRGLTMRLREIWLDRFVLGSE